MCGMMLTCLFTETHAYILFLHAEAAMLRSYTTPQYQAAQESQLSDLETTESQEVKVL